jgi:protein-S-isoprenylcysteine O-methyltransferase Ste14
MTTNTQSIVVNEEDCLYQNALLGLLLAALFTFQYLDMFIESLPEINTWLYVLFGIVYIAIWFMIIRTLIKVITSGKNISKDAYWFSVYEDEYFNYINNKGYKYAFNVLLAYLTIISIFGTDFAPISIESFCKFGLILGFLTYSSTVIFLLKGKDE